MPPPRKPNNSKDFAAFTLAEVLITLSILGVIAVLVIPNIIKKYQDIIDVARVRQAYSILSSAIEMAVAENGPIENWNWPDKTTCWKDENAKFLAQQLKPYFNIKHDCSSYSNTTNCFGGYERSNNTPLKEYESGSHYFRLKNLGNRLTNNNGISWSNGLYGYQLKNGISIGFASHCMNTPQGTFNGMYNRDGIYGKGTVYIDINGPKGPNKLGYDFFRLRIHRWPGSIILNDDSGNTSVDYCSVEKAKTTYTYNGGINCVNHVIKHGNMDYKYRELTQNEF